MPTVIEGLTDSESEAEEEIDLDCESKKSDADDDFNGYSVENSYMAEKEDACVALRDLAMHCGNSFIVHLDQAAEEVYKMLNFPHEDVRQAAVGAMAQFAITLARSQHQGARDGKKNELQ